MISSRVAGSVDELANMDENLARDKGVSKEEYVKNRREVKRAAQASASEELVNLQPSAALLSSLGSLKETLKKAKSANERLEKENSGLKRALQIQKDKLEQRNGDFQRQNAQLEQKRKDLLQDKSALAMSNGLLRHELLAKLQSEEEKQRAVSRAMDQANKLSCLNAPSLRPRTKLSTVVNPHFRYAPLVKALFKKRSNTLQEKKNLENTVQSQNGRISSLEKENVMLQRIIQSREVHQHFEDRSSRVRELSNVPIPQIYSTIHSTRKTLPKISVYNPLENLRTLTSYTKQEFDRVVAERGQASLNAATQAKELRTMAEIMRAQVTLPPDDVEQRVRDCTTAVQTTAKTSIQALPSRQKKRKTLDRVVVYDPVEDLRGVLRETAESLEEANCDLQTATDDKNSLERELEMMTSIVKAQEPPRDETTQATELVSQLKEASSAARGALKPHTTRHKMLSSVKVYNPVAEMRTLLDQTNQSLSRITNEKQEAIQGKKDVSDLSASLASRLADFATLSEGLLGQVPDETSVSNAFGKLQESVKSAQDQIQGMSRQAPTASSTREVDEASSALGLAAQGEGSPRRRKLLMLQAPERSNFRVASVVKEGKEIVDNACRLLVGLASVADGNLTTPDGHVASAFSKIEENLIESGNIINRFERRQWNVLPGFDTNNFEGYMRMYAKDLEQMMLILADLVRQITKYTHELQNMVRGYRQLLV
ncbi:hypothetical protein IWX50DRAFT_693441 [Phyllosticta citricarpa]|uniref:Uncharacterized protein n=2 Tax=Phyllosticta TaxID=121621 RepID=A0ABR1M7B9_9PEZI